MLLPLTAIAGSSIPFAAAFIMCAKDRQTVHAADRKGKSSKSRRSSRSSKNRKSSRSKERSRSRKGKSGQKSRRSSKRSQKTQKSEKSEKSQNSKAKKSSKSGTNRKSTAIKLAKDAEKKLEKTGKSKKSEKSGASSSRKRREEANKEAVKKVEKIKAKSLSEKSEKSIKSIKAKNENRGKLSVVDEVNAIKHSQNLNVAPAKIPFDQFGGVKSIQIKNNSSERKAYKLKCSDNSLYRVNPVYGFAEPHSQIKIDILRNNGDKKMDKLVVLTATATEEKDAREVFNRNNLEKEMMVVPLVVQ